MTRPNTSLPVTERDARRPDPAIEAATRAPLLTRAEILALSADERQKWLEKVVSDIEADARLESYERLTKVELRGPRTADFEITDVETGTVYASTYVMTAGRWQFRRGRGTKVQLRTFEAYLVANAA